jgi:hypothetical protein
VGVSFTLEYSMASKQLHYCSIREREREQRERDIDCTYFGLLKWAMYAVLNMHTKMSDEGEKTDVIPRSPNEGWRMVGT